MSAVSVIRVDLVNFEAFSNYIFYNVFNFFYNNENDCILLDYKLDINTSCPESSVIFNKFNIGVNYSLNDRRIVVFILKEVNLECKISAHEFIYQSRW